MATITLTVVVSDIATVRSLFDKIKVYRSTTGVTGPYVEITSAPTRISLVEGQTIYSYTDTSGDDAYYYKTSFFNSASLIESSLSDAQQGEGDPALDVMRSEEHTSELQSQSNLVCRL